MSFQFFSIKTPSSVQTFVKKSLLMFFSQKEAHYPTGQYDEILPKKSYIVQLKSILCQQYLKKLQFSLLKGDLTAQLTPNNKE